MLTEQETELLAQIAGRVARMRMDVPAIFFLESVKPMNFVGSQVMQFFQPMIAAFFPTNKYDQLRALLEKRESIEVLIQKIEQARKS